MASKYRRTFLKAKYKQMAINRKQKENQLKELRDWNIVHKTCNKSLILILKNAIEENTRNEKTHKNQTRY